jgi:adenylate cyclase
VPGLADPDHARRAVDAAAEVLRASGGAEPNGPWVPVGVGIHSGVACVGVVGKAEGVTDISVLGDVPNTAARLASAAQQGEILVSPLVVERTGLDRANLEKRSLELKGMSERQETWVLKVDPAYAARLAAS